MVSIAMADRIISLARANAAAHCPPFSQELIRALHVMVFLSIRHGAIVANKPKACSHSPTFSQALMAVAQTMVSTSTWSSTIALKSLSALVHMPALPQALIATLYVLVLSSIWPPAISLKSCRARSHCPPFSQALIALLQAMVLRTTWRRAMSPSSPNATAQAPDFSQAAMAAPKWKTLASRPASWSQRIAAKGISDCRESRNLLSTRVAARASGRPDSPKCRRNTDPTSSRPTLLSRFLRSRIAFSSFNGGAKGRLSMACKRRKVAAKRRGRLEFGVA
mmetsp:Transcript_90739/g.259596  ORF Transcript_90739/g.259596 Transcript_90739/m.259596 type:complete len:279 (-) Transcript_90739:2-838(-)